jgi:PAS domain S-box-containing protein
MSGKTRPIHVLVVGPSVDSVVETLDQASEDIVVAHESTASSARNHLTTGQTDCLVTTYTLLGSDGLGLLSTVREMYPAIPVILLAEDGSEKIASQAIAADATDYLPTPSTPSEVERLADCIHDAVERTSLAQRLQELTGASTDIHWMFTADWDDLLFINDAYESIWGRSTATLRTNPRDFLQGVHPEDRDRIRTAMDTLSSGDSIDIEVRVNPEEDYQRWVWIEGEPIRDATGTVVRVTGFARDITDRVERRQNLKRAEARFRTLAELFPNGGVHYFDDELRYQYVSGSGFEHIDTSPDDLVGNTIYEVEPYTAAEIETLEPLMKETLADNRETVEIPYEGHIYKIHSVPLHDDSEVVIGGFFITQDVTEQRERERELAARSAAMDASIDGMAILDSNDEYAFVNQAHVDIYGYDDPDAFLGNSWKMCYDEDEQERFDTEVMPTLFDEGGWRGEAVGTRGDGSPFPQELSLSIMDDGRIICVVRDISDRKEREQQLERQNERLEEFAGVVSHDLQNPLQIVTSRLELAREDCDSPHLDHATEAIDRSTDLIDDLLTLAREGDHVDETEPIDLAALAETCWRNVPTTEATLTTETTCTIRADRSRLRQLLENLFQNAVEHSNQRVTVRIGELDDGFYIADDGSGIPVDERAEIFEHGYSTTQDGTGFGLSIVQDIVVGHGWKIELAESEEGGARFEITGVEQY